MNGNLFTDNNKERRKGKETQAFQDSPKMPHANQTHQIKLKFQKLTNMGVSYNIAHLHLYMKHTSRSSFNAEASRLINLQNEDMRGLEMRRNEREVMNF